ncbi:hypothetical protein CHH28_09890 [Bacterioplanes sanyensis]|uniref:Uncharacterized protein n=1 Tax=Bacterioplanes sanyensis TaxID=1249553 RepID=A0A222FKS8_9GAMM|nr:hypothetical protein CHH28_09890 [Bacterioplanes sanyensis]
MAGPDSWHGWQAPIAGMDGRKWPNVGSSMMEARSMMEPRRSTYLPNSGYGLARGLYSITMCSPER